MFLKELNFLGYQQRKTFGYVIIYVIPLPNSSLFFFFQMTHSRRMTWWKLVGLWEASRLIVFVTSVLLWPRSFITWHSRDQKVWITSEMSWSKSFAWWWKRLKSADMLNHYTGTYITKFELLYIIFSWIMFDWKF